MDTQAKIRAVISDHVDLDARGMHDGDRDYNDNPIDETQFEFALFWLTLRGDKLRNVRTRGTSSYGYKHVAEQDLRKADEAVPGVLSPQYSARGWYISNGAFIAAALHLGYKIRRTHPGSPNVFLNFSYRKEL